MQSWMMMCRFCRGCHPGACSLASLRGSSSSTVCFFLFLGRFSLWWRGYPHHTAAIIVPAPFLLALVIMWLLAAIAAVKWCLLGKAKPGR